MLVKVLVPPSALVCDMPKLSDLLFKGGYRISREVFTRYNVHCPVCNKYVEEPTYSYENALSVLNAHSRLPGHSETNSEYDTKKS